MSNVRICADTANSASAEVLAGRLGAEVTSGEADIALVSGIPASRTSHVIVTGQLSDAIDEWDQHVAPQTLAGALWIGPDQDVVATAAAWWVLRSQTPTTPLSDLTDNNERCLRWSVLAVDVVPLTAPADVAVDEAGIRSQLDDLPEIQNLGKAIDRIGGDSADLVLRSVENFRTAIGDLNGLANLPPSGQTPEFDAIVAEHLRQVQRSGFGRWRGAKARAQSQADLTEAAKSVAADRLREVIAARHSEEFERSRTTAARDASALTHEHVQSAALEVQLPVQPDFERVPRSWSASAPTARRYVLVAEEHGQEFADLPEVTVRTSPQVPPDEAWCLIIQSGFSLPGLRG